MTDTDLPARLEAVLTERFTELGNPFSRMRINFQGPDGWPASREIGPRDVAEVLRELLPAEAASSAPATDRAAELEQEVRRLRLMVDEYGAGASALTGKLEQLRDIGHRLAAHAVGFQDVLDDSDRGPWARTVGADITELCAVLDAPAAPVLPTSSDRAAVYRELADQETQLAVADDLDRRRDMATARRQLVKELRRVAAGTPQPETQGRDALMAAHVALATHAGRDQAALARVRQLHDRLAEETDLSGPDDLITKGSAARRIATALDGWNPALLPPCPVEFEAGGTCAKPAGHRPPGSDDPHVPATLAAVAAQPAKEAETRIVAYRSPLPGALSVYCTNHTDELGTGVMPLTSDDLPDGGICVQCGADVLIPQPPEEA